MERNGLTSLSPAHRMPIFNENLLLSPAARKRLFNTIPQSRGFHKKGGCLWGRIFLKKSFSPGKNVV